MLEEEANVPENDRVSRRKVIKRGMILGGVTLWAAPVAAVARHGFVNTSASQLNAEQLRAQALERANQLRSQFSSQTNGVTIQQQTSPCTGYPPGSCLTFECGEVPTTCGTGSGGAACFCDVDAGGNCVCVQNAFCSTLPNCVNGACPPGYVCIPSSCCGVPKCAVPCGGTAQASTAGAGGGATIGGF